MSKESMPPDLSMLTEQFKALAGNMELVISVFEMLPTPIQVFTPEGLCIFANRAGLELHRIPDASLIVGKYNYNDDPVMKGILGQDVYDRVSRGDTVFFPDFISPIQDLIDRGIIIEKPWEAAKMDLFFLPVWEGETFKYTFLIYTVKNTYQGRTDIVKAQQYMDEHWRDEFNIDKIAQAASLSKRHFQRIFKEVTCTTPFEYYQKVKIGKIQEKLLEGNLSIEQAFDACGVDSHGAYLILFKEKTGLSPSEYRKKNGIK